MQPRGERQTLADTCAAVVTAGGGGGSGGAASGSGGVFVAFTKGLPNRFLAPKSVPAFFAARGAEDSALPGQTALAGAAGAPLAPTAAPAPSGGGKWLVGEVTAIEGPLVASSGTASDHWQPVLAADRRACRAAYSYYAINCSIAVAPGLMVMTLMMVMRRR